LLDTIAKDVYIMPSIKRNPTQFNTAKFRRPVLKPREMKNVWTAATIVKKLDETGRRMLRKELKELSLMQKKRDRRQRKLFSQLREGKISSERLEAELKTINSEIETKNKRINSLIDKREYLIGPRIKTFAENSLKDSFFDIYNHKAFSSRVKVLFNRKGKDIQTIVISDVDKLKISNELSGHIRGGAVLLKAFVDAAKEVCKKYGGLTAKYGSDEFTFHFDKPADEVQKIMEEFQQRAKNKLMHGPLKEPIQKGVLPGTSTCSIIQVDFDFQKRNFHPKARYSKNETKTNHKINQIYANVMDHASRNLMALKKQNKRGTISIVKDDQIIEKK
jgi:GGDEF domain-containing protein